MCHVNHKVLVNMEELCSQSTFRTTPQTTQEKLRRRRTDTTHRPTYSMARAIRGYCIAERFQLSMPLFVLLLAWLTSLACACWSYCSCWPTNGYIQRWGPAHVKSYSKSASSVHTTLVYMSCRAHGVLHQCIGCLWHSCWTASASQTHSPWAVRLYVYFCVIFCGLRLCYATLSHIPITVICMQLLRPCILHMYLLRLAPQWHAFV